MYGLFTSRLGFIMATWTKGKWLGKDSHSHGASGYIQHELISRNLVRFHMGASSTTMVFPTENDQFWGVLGVPPFQETSISSTITITTISFQRLHSWPPAPVPRIGTHDLSNQHYVLLHRSIRAWLHCLWGLVHMELYTLQETNISHQTGSLENHRLKSDGVGRGYGIC